MCRAPTLLNGPFTPMPLHELFPHLSSTEKLFFAALDHELEKIEAFYEKQEKALQEHTQMLKEQLNELAEHRKQFYVSPFRLRLQIDAESCFVGGLSGAQADASICT